MHLRTVTVKRNGRTYRYTQLVQSYRREDGMPAKRVIANLGTLSEVAIENLKLAFKHTEEDATPLVAISAMPAPQPPVANLRFLDVAVVWETWRGFGLQQMLSEIIDDPDDSIPASEVVGSLVVQRCIAPGSKLYAYRWFPTTALPELSGIRPAHFNNSRLHRVLDALDAAGDRLQDGLPTLYRERNGPAMAIFLDVTDTYFVGGSCELAERSKVKEGFYRKAIGIVLACDEHGFPLRWKVVSARRNDGRVIADMVDRLRSCDWLGHSPIVCDRSMGNATGIEKLATSGLKYLVGVPANEYDSHTARIPHDAFAHVALESTRKTKEEDIKHAARVALEAGMEKVHDNLFALDLKREDVENDATVSPTAAARNLQRALELQADIEASGAKSKSEYARRRKISKSRLTQLLGPTRLAPDIRADILAGRARGLNDDKMRKLWRLEHEAQRLAFKAHRVDDGLEARCPRLVVYFNPEMFVEQRQNSYEDRVETSKFIAELNQRLASPRSKMTTEQVRDKVRKHLGSRRLLDCYDVDINTVEHQGRKRLFVSAVVNQNAWRRQHRYDGFVLLAAHPELPHSAAELSRLYRLKETVERDFRTIKSTVKVRPIYHYTPAKVRAHVTLCVLALLVERVIESKLSEAGKALSAPAAFEILGVRHLNLYETETQRLLYTATKASAEQGRLLRVLGLKHLASDKEINRLIKPR